MNNYERLATVHAKYKTAATIRLPGTQPQGKLRIGYGVSLEIGEEIAAYNAKSVLLIADPTIVQLGIHQFVLSALAQADISCTVFSQIKPEPDMSCLLNVQKVIREHPFDAVIGLGGGSAMDIAKMAACLAVSSHCIRQLMKDASLIEGKIPLFLLPTTAGTGSEVSPYAVASDHETKLFITSPQLYASVALVDPLLTLTVPKRITAATGLDALTHGIEGACSCTNPYTQAMAVKCAELVFCHLPTAVHKGQDLEARYYMAYASVLGMLAYAQGGGLYAHSASYIMTTEIGLPHGAGCGLALPYTLALNKREINGLLDDFTTAINRSQLFSSSCADETIACFIHLAEEIEMPTTLAQVGYEKHDIQKFGMTLLTKYHRAKNPKQITVNDAVKLAENMYYGRL